MLIFNSNTKLQLDNFLADPSHGLLIEGEMGAGKSTVADYIASQLLRIGPDKLSEYPYFKRITPIKNAISIEEIRLSKQFFGLRTLGHNPIRRVLIVEDAGRMTTEAQNALLKFLEEPPADTVIIFTSNPESHLLPTIYSRMQRLTVLPPAKNALGELFDGQYTVGEIDKAYLISGGNLGLMNSILNNDERHPLVSSITLAKEIVSQSKFERLARVDKLSKDRDQLPNLLLAMERLLSLAIRQSGISTEKTLAISAALSKVLSAREALARTPNIKMLLTDLFLNI